MNKTSVYLRHTTFAAASAFLLGSTAFVAPPAPVAQQEIQIPTTSATPGVKKAPPSYKSYTYYGDHYRDPFIALTGDIRTDPNALDRPPAVASLILKGIVQDAKGRMALLTSGVNSYILKGGRLYDGRNRMVKKIAGVIKTDSVVIIGADRTVRELKTKAPL